MSDAAMFGPAVLSVTQGISAFTTFLPRFTDVRRADPLNNPDVAADVRMGELAATALTMGVGVIASSLTQSAVPAVTALLVCALLVFLYESTLRTDRPMERSTERKPNRLVIVNDAGAI